MSKWDGKFNGTYDTSRYADHSLADDIMDAGCGKFAYEGPNGELIRESDSRIDVWGRGDGKGTTITTITTALMTTAKPLMDGMTDPA